VSLAERLSGLGCGFALDDFGTGYGSFTYLKHLPVDYIKIDMEFVRNLRAGSPDVQVVSLVDYRNDVVAAGDDGRGRGKKVAGGEVAGVQRQH